MDNIPLDKIPAPKHTYQIGYRRVPGNKNHLFHNTFENRTVQEIMRIVEELESDRYQAEIIYITMITE